MRKRWFSSIPERDEDQKPLVKLFEKTRLESNLCFAKQHRDIASKFGRFPLLNALPGRESTIQEIEYFNSGEVFLG